AGAPAGPAGGGRGRVLQRGAVAGAGGRAGNPRHRPRRAGRALRLAAGRAGEPRGPVRRDRGRPAAGPGRAQPQRGGAPGAGGVRSEGGRAPGALHGARRRAARAGRPRRRGRRMTRVTVGGTSPRVLVAGVGNVFRGDEGFGVEVVRRLERRPLPPGVDVADFGIRRIDLLHALGDDYRTVVLVEAASRGGVPGTVSLVKPDAAPAGLAVDPRAPRPFAPAALARATGKVPARTLLVTCEPSVRAADAPWEMRLSEPVGAAVGVAARLVEGVVAAEIGRLVARRAARRTV